MSLLLNTHPVRQYPTGVPKMSIHHARYWPLLLPLLALKTLSNRPAKKIIPDKMSGICPVFQQSDFP